MDHVARLAARQRRDLFARALSPKPRSPARYQNIQFPTILLELPKWSISAQASSARTTI